MCVYDVLACVYVARCPVLATRRLLRLYGFCLPANPYDTVQLYPPTFTKTTLAELETDEKNLASLIHQDAKMSEGHSRSGRSVVARAAAILAATTLGGARQTAALPPRLLGRFPYGLFP